jgi:heat shock protein HslJ
VHRALLLLATSLLIAACADSPGRASPAPGITGAWQLVGDVPRAAALPAGARATLDVGNGQVGGTSFCNHYGGTYQLDGDSLVVDGLGGTDMGCEPGIMAAETAYLRALAAVRTASVEDGELVLTGPGGELRFAPVAPTPERELTGTRWVLDTVVEGGTASSTVGEPAVLELRPDATFTASTGCRSLDGSWRSSGDAVLFDDYAYDTFGCAAPVDRQDQHVLAVLAGGPLAVVDGDRLTLTGADGRALVYRATG